MTEVRHYLITKKKELEDKLDPILTRRTVQRKELDETEKLAGELRSELIEVTTALAAILAKDQETEAKLRLTIKGAILSVLKDHPQGLTSGDILKEINTRYFDGAIKRESLSPQLTRLKRDDQKIDLRGEIWFRLPAADEATLFATKS